MVGAVITDYLNTSHPLGSFPFVRDAVMPVLEEAGATPRTAEVFDLGMGGTVKIAESMRVGVVSLSGAALAHLRAQNLFGDYLAALAQEAHAVTILHAALDRRVDAPTHVQRLYRAARRGQVKLSRKSLDPLRDIDHWIKPGLADGRDTGTVYLGPPTARIRAAVYDKRDERLRAGAADPGPLLRHELRTKKVGATLRDAFDPTALFWHYMAPELLKRPTGVADWSPHAEGYELPAMRQYTPQERIQRIIDNSLDLPVLFDLATALNPDPATALDQVFTWIRQRYARHLQGAAMIGGPAGTEPRSGVHPGALEQPPDESQKLTLQ
jgi:hypothetical protein